MPNYLKQEQEILTPKLLKLAAASRRPMIERLSDAELVSLVADLNDALSKAGAAGEGSDLTPADILLAASRRAKAALRARGLGPRSSQGKAAARAAVAAPKKAAIKRDPIARTPKTPKRGQTPRVGAGPVKVVVAPSAAVRTPAAAPAREVDVSSLEVTKAAAPVENGSDVKVKGDKLKKKDKSPSDKAEEKAAKKAARKAAKQAERAARKAARVAERELKKVAKKAARKAERKAEKANGGHEKGSKKNKEKGKDKSLPKEPKL